MELKMLDSGIEYLNRFKSNRDRMGIANFALGSTSGYAVTSRMLGFVNGVELLNKAIFGRSVVVDEVTLTCIIPETLDVTFGEIAVTAVDGTYLAMAVLSTPFRSPLGQQTELSLVLNYPGLGAQLQYQSDRTILVQTRPDYDDALLQLTAAALKKDTFKGLVTNETGNTLLELMAGIVDFDSAMFESAYQEAFSDTAKVTASLYAIQIMLRNRLTRKTPASATVNISRPDNSFYQTIPAFTQFSASGVSMFNRNAITFDSGVVSVNATLHVGTVVITQLSGQGTDYQFYATPDSSFTVSDTDVQVFVGSAPIPVVQDVLWHYGGKPAVQDFTDKKGSLVLSFGNATIATKPALSDVITVIYAVTNGSQGNDLTKNGVTVSCAADSRLHGVLTTGISGGGDQPDASVYRRIGGDIFGASNGAVTPNQYTAVALQYPGVIDAVVKGQRDLSPFDVRWFNVAKVVLLTQSDWSIQDKADFAQWFQQRTMYSMRYLVTTGNVPMVAGNENGGAGVLTTDEPRIRTSDVQAVVSCRADSDLAGIKVLAEKAVREVYAPKTGTLERNIYKTDITDAIRAIAPEQIDFVELVLPTLDLIMSVVPPDVSATVIPDTGTLPAGTYVYGVSSYDLHGETPATFITVEVSQANSSVRLDIGQQAAALGYNVYGRTSSATASWLASVTQTGLGIVPQWFDTNPFSPAQRKPVSINTSGIHYGVLGSLHITTKYSTRRAKGG